MLELILSYADLFRDDPATRLTSPIKCTIAIIIILPNSENTLDKVLTKYRKCGSLIIEPYKLNTTGLAG